MRSRTARARCLTYTPLLAREVRILSLFSLLLLSSFAAFGAAGAQGTVGFRSGFTEGNGIPPRGRVDVDYGSSVLEANGVRGFLAGEVTAHVPMTRRIGVRVHLNSYSRITTPQSTVAGREDMGIGTAFNVSENHGWRPSAALLTRVDVPSGSLPGQGTAWRPTMKAALSWRLPSRVTLASNFGVAIPGARGEQFTQHFGSLWLGRPVAGRIGSFAEIFAFDREARAGASTRYVRGGLTLLVRNTLHVDLHASTQLTGVAPRRMFGIGAKHRL